MRKGVVILVFFLIGLPLGLVMRGVISGSSELKDSTTSGADEWQIRVDGYSHSSTKNLERSRDTRQNQDQLTFTIKQWRELQSGRSHLQIRLAECIQWSRQVFRPIANGGDEDVGEDITVEGGPDLTALVNFLGLDEIQMNGLGAALKKYGFSIRDFEIQNALPTYRGGGKLEIQMPDSDGRISKAYLNFREECLDLLGAKQFARFEAVALNDDFSGKEMMIEVSVEKNFIKLVHPEGEGFVSLNDVIGKEAYILKSMIKPGNRFHHLGLEVDWSRLVREALEERGGD